MTNYNDGKWHGWNGGECPVHVNSKIEWVWNYKNGDTLISSGHAGDAAFLGTSYGAVIAFRVIKEYKEPRDWWSVGSVNYPTIELAETALASAKARGAFAEEIIHVREVIE